MAAMPAQAATNVATANPSAPPGQWVGSEGVYPYNWNWSNQTQIGPSNLNQLQVSWVYPTPPTPSQYLAYNKFTTVPIGITFTGSMVNGIVYTMTQYMLIQAMNAQTGALIWQAQLPNMKFNCMHNNLPVAGANLTGHFHNIWYTAGTKGVFANTPVIWVMASNHTAFAYNALTGSLLEHWQTYNPCATEPNGATGAAGNFGLYDTTTQNAVIDAARGILVTGSSDPESTDAARGFFVGYNISVNPPKELWQTFIQPPQDGSDPNWAISDVANMTNAWIFDAPNGTAVNLKTLPSSQLNSMLYNDWGYSNYFNKTSTHSYAGVGTSWGANWALDPTTGNAFVATSEPSDFPNGTLRPGPDLWADSILSINDQTGQINWAFQTNPHDLWDLDCSWTDMLATLNINGNPTQAVIKTCKDAYMFALNAQTGALLWYFFPGASDLGYNGLPSSVCSGAGHCPIPGTNFKASIWTYPFEHQLDPTNRSEMTRGWPDAPSKGWFYFVAAIAEMVGGYDPTTGIAFYVPYNGPGNTTAGDANGPGYVWGTSTSKATGAPSLTQDDNATVWAINANTGKPLWEHYIPALGFRGGISATNGMILVPLDNGSLLFLNEQTGTILKNLFIGSAMVTQAMIGTDASGNSKIVLPAELPISAGVYATTGRTTSTPGFLFAVGLGPSPAVTTATATATITATVTGPGQTATSTATVTAPGATATSTATVTAPGATAISTATITSTAPGTVSTVVSSTGISTTTFYAVAALAVIFVIATGFLAMRGKKPAP